MINIYNDINKLEATLRQTTEFENLKVAVDAVKTDEEAKTLFQNFRNLQMKMQEKQVAGEEILEDEYIYAQKTAQLAQQNPLILQMLEAELALSSIIEEINRIIVKPVQGLYDGI